MALLAIAGLGVELLRLIKHGQQIQHGFYTTFLQTLDMAVQFQQQI